MTHFNLLRTCAVLAALSLLSVSAQETWTGADNNQQFADALNWSPNTIPTLGVSTVIPSSASYQVVVSGTNGVGSLSLGALAGLTVSGNLQINGNVTNAGALTINSYLQLENNVAVSGAGTLSLNGGYIGTNSNDYILSNQSTILGSGTIGTGAGPLYSNLSLVNIGVINANSPAAGASLIIGGTGGSISNSGTLEATSGGTLNLQTSTAVNNQGGKIFAIGAGSTVDIDTQIQGGSIATVLGGTVQNSASATAYLNGASASGAVTITDGSTYTAQSTGLTQLNGTVTLGSSSGGTLAGEGLIQLQGNTMLSGPGSLTLSGSGQMGTNGNGYSLTNNSTIQGAGLLGSGAGALYNNLGLTNNGIINANSLGNTLTVGGDGLPIINNATMEATGGGVLSLTTSSPVSNQLGTISADGSGSTVDVSTAIQGGTISTSNNGVVQTSGTAAELDGSSHGPITLADGSTYTANSGSFTKITGTLTLGTSAGSTLSLGGQLELVGDTTFGGSGVVMMTGDPSVPSGAQIGTNNNGYTLTNKATIEGSGLLGSNAGALYGNLNLNNEATVNANAAAATLTVAGTGQVVNAGTMEATNGGILDLETGNALNNQSGTISSSGTGSMVNVTTTIQGGTLTTSNGGSMQTLTSASLDGATYGAISLTDGSTYTSGSSAFTTIKGGLTLGTVAGSTLNLGGQLELIGDTTFGGTGTVMMTGNGSATAPSGAQIGTNGNAYTLTNQVTMEGSGLIGSNLDSLYGNVNFNNQATVNANVAGATLTVAGASQVVNAGTMEATNGGTLNLNSGNPLNNQNGTISSNGPASAVDVTNTTIQGGVLSTSNGGTMQSIGSVQLDGASHGAITLADGSTYASGSSAFTTIKGTLTLGTVTGSTLSLGGQLQLVGDTTLAGPGTMVMTGNGSISAPSGAQVGTNGNSYTLANQATIEGTGVIGSAVGVLYSNVTFDNQGTVNANVASGTLALGGTGSFTNSGLLEATDGGILALDHTSIDNTGGNIDAGLGSTIDFLDGTLITGGDLFGTGDLVVGGTNELLTDTGTVYFGDSESLPGLLSETGSFDANGAVYESIDAASNGQFDLSGSFGLGLDSILDIDVANGTLLTNGENFTLVNYGGSESGIFSTINANVGAGEWTVAYAVGDPEVVLTYGGATMTVGGPPPPPGVAEPSCWLDLTVLAALALAAPALKRCWGAA